MIAAAVCCPASYVGVNNLFQKRDLKEIWRKTGFCLDWGGSLLHYTALLPFKVFLRGVFSFLFKALGISCAACCLWLFPCLSVSSVQSPGVAQPTGSFRSQLGSFLEKCECLIPNFSVNRDLLISFMLSLISEHQGPACIVLTQWNFLCGETYVADSLHQLKTDLCLQKNPKQTTKNNNSSVSFLPTHPSNTEFSIPTEYLPQSTQELALNG